ncbi:MAG: polymerase, sigma-24 subunit, subfamily [Verrucomicrobiales bacterium]|jgi:RNA polymerase sigma factor (sigma-70 family)|nr:polymerase, sigma-24 subunit, subfamily [Verrucomicrobiales bacterium]
MQDIDDHQLLREYVEHNSEEAFAALVTRHVNKVYSAALRHTGSSHQAEEITQSVFVTLARQSSHLAKAVILEGWLYQTARLTALTRIRGEIRRAKREQEAHMQAIVNENESEVWKEIQPMLDSAIAELNETDRHAVVLRFFYEKNMKDVGLALGSTESAATVRLHRALDKMRTFFIKHGVSSSTAIIAAAISANSVQAAPAQLAKAITGVAMIKGAATGGVTLTVLKSGALKTMTGLKLTTLAVILANVFTSQKIVATHFNFAGKADAWTTQSNAALIWLVLGCGFPIFFVVIGHLARHLAKNSNALNLPHREYWLAPEQVGETSEYFYRHFHKLAFMGALFMLSQMLIQIDANHQNPPHLSASLILVSGGCYIAAVVVWMARMFWRFHRIPASSTSAPGVH